MIKVLYWACQKTRTLTWCFDIRHFWGGKHHVGLWPVLFRPPGFLSAPRIHMQTLTEGISCSQLRWQERPQHNPLFTADSSFSCVLVDWLYIIKLQFTAADWNPDSALWMEQRILCDRSARLLCCLEKPDIGEISQLPRTHPRDRFQWCWTEQKASGGARSPEWPSKPAFEKRLCHSRAARAVPALKIEATRGNLFPVSGIHQVRPCFLNPTTQSWGTLKKSWRWRLCGLYEVDHSNVFLI